MRAEVGYFEWTDLEHDRSVGTEPTSTLLVFTAGPAGQPSGETFQVIVATQEALAELIARDDIVIGRHYLFVSIIRQDRVEDFIRDRVGRLDGRDWNQLAEKIARIGYWEFEDYTERQD
jgi:hypothetical protein